MKKSSIIQYLLLASIALSIPVFAQDLEDDFPRDLVDGRGDHLPGSGLRYEQDGMIVETYSIEVENAYQLELAVQGLATEAAKDQNSVPDGEFELSVGVLEDPEIEGKIPVSPEDASQKLVSQLKKKGVKTFQVAQYSINAPFRYAKKIFQGMSFRQQSITLDVIRISVPTVMVSLGMSAHYSTEVALAGGFIAGLFGSPFALFNEQNADFLSHFRVYKPKHLSQVKEWIRSVHAKGIARMEKFLEKKWVSRIVKKHSVMKVIDSRGAQKIVDAVPEVLNQTHGYGLAFGQEVIFSGAIAKVQEAVKNFFNASFNPTTWGEIFLHSAFATAAQYPMEAFEAKYKKLALLRGVPYQTWKIGQKAWSTFGSNLAVSGVVLINSHSGSLVTAAGWGLWVVLATTGVVKTIKISKTIALEVANQKRIADLTAKCRGALEDNPFGNYFLGEGPIDFSEEVWTDL